MKHILKSFCMISVFFAVLVLCACGKISEPEPVEGSGYPHTYPTF